MMSSPIHSGLDESVDVSSDGSEILIDDIEDDLVQVCSVYSQSKFQIAYNPVIQHYKFI